MCVLFRSYFLIKSSDIMLFLILDVRSISSAHQTAAVEADLNTATSSRIFEFSRAFLYFRPSLWKSPNELHLKIKTENLLEQKY